MPRHFRQATSKVTPEQVAEAVVCGPDPERHRAAIAEFEQAGFDHVYVHQVGDDQEGFLRVLSPRSPRRDRRPLTHAGRYQ